VIVGSGEPVAGMQRRAAELGIAVRCHFAGYVPYRRIPLYVKSLDVGASISLLPERAVNSELKVRQYLACGKPIVISPGGNEFVPEQGFGSVVEPNDIEAITREIERWLALGPVERDAFAERAARYMHEHLSMAAAIERRLRLWAERMPA
jgi:glycosyltransferase involved in cell wall biosynthesis